MVRLRRKKSPVEQMRERIQSIDWQEQLETGREQAAEARERLSDIQERAGETQQQLRQWREQAGRMRERAPEPPRKESRLRFSTGLLLGICIGVVVSLILIWRASQQSAGRAQPTNIELLPRRGSSDPSGEVVSG